MTEWKPVLKAKIPHKDGNSYAIGGGYIVRWTRKNLLYEGMICAIHNILWEDPWNELGKGKGQVIDYEYSIIYKGHYEYVNGADLEYLEEPDDICFQRISNFDWEAFKLTVINFPMS